MTEHRVEGFPDYSISDSGIVTSYRRAVPRPLKPWCRGGYLWVRLFAPDGSNCDRRVHHLVLEEFVGQCPDGMEGCHDNDDPFDNRLANLRWDTHIANMRDNSGAPMRGLCRGFGSDSIKRAVTALRRSRSHLDEESISAIRLMRGLKSQAAIAKQYGISQGMVWKIQTNRAWK